MSTDVWWGPPLDTPVKPSTPEWTNSAEQRAAYWRWAEWEAQAELRLQAVTLAKVRAALDRLVMYTRFELRGSGNEHRDPWQSVLRRSDEALALTDVGSVEVKTTRCYEHSTPTKGCRWCAYSVAERIDGTPPGASR